ncbi:MAG: immunoglobulin domain-containing protein, partial [Planctomycetota bacterium]
STTLSVTATGSAPLSYQWYQDGSLLGGATSSSLTIDPVGAADAGVYTVEVTNACGTATSAGATLTVLTAPNITSQPGNDTVCVGGLTMLSVTATGSAPLSYQWYQDGSLLGGATSSSLTIDPVDAADAGVYTVDVTNVCGTSTSAGATLTVLTAPSITTQPIDITVCEGEAAQFGALAMGSPPLTYQWFHNGALLSGETTDQLLLATTTLVDAGAYHVVVTNSCGSVTSAMPSLTVNSGLACDCNGNGTADSVDISMGTSADNNNDNIPDECQNLFLRGEVNNDGTYDVSDPVVLLIYLFEGGSLSCLDSADVNDDGAVNLADVASLLGVLFSGATAPPAPFASCGSDPTADTLTCDSYAGCPGV